MSTLYKDLRSNENLFSAWRHVKRSAQTSRNKLIRGQASEFEHQHQRHIRTIQDQLRKGRFAFDKYDGVLKDKKEREAKNKKPRPIAIGSIKNRVVQRAVLQVLQPRKVIDPSNPYTKFRPKNDSRIGALNDVNCSRFGVGGLMAPYGGVQPAIKLIMDGMSEGAGHYFQSDIKEFFTRIPTATIVQKIFEQTGDREITDIFSSALEVHLKNEDELLQYANLFPSNGIGVAQGSSLSAFAGNVLLYDFDHELNSMGVIAVRYIDDIFLLSSSKTALDAAVSFAKGSLEKFGFSLYEPAQDADKAASGDCKDSFTFLGCNLQPNKCVPSKASTDRIIRDIREELNFSKKAITTLVSGGDKFDHQYARSATLNRIGSKLYGWEKSFSFCTAPNAFRHIDNKIAQYVESYEHEVGRKIRRADKPKRMRALGIPSTEQLFEADRTARD